MCRFGTQCNANGALKVSYPCPGMSDSSPGGPNPTQKPKEKKQDLRELSRGQKERKMGTKTINMQFQQEVQDDFLNFKE